MSDDWMKTCIDCDRPTEWIRYTQFAGSHPYCEEHAKGEKDFMKDDSYTSWENLNDENEVN